MDSATILPQVIYCCTLWIMLQKLLQKLKLGTFGSVTSWDEKSWGNKWSRLLTMSQDLQASL